MCKKIRLLILCVISSYCSLLAPQAGIASIVSLDASLLAPNGKAYFFDKDKYYRFNFQTKKVEKIADIGVGGWIGLGGNIDTALMHPNGKAYFFAGDRYYRYSFQKRKIDKVGKIGVDGWMGLPKNIDAAILAPNGKAYFFAGDKYYRFNFQSDQVDNGYPRKIGIDGWKGLDKNIDAAVMAPNGKAYFFINDNYYRFNFQSKKVDNGYPLKIGVGGWKGLKVKLSSPENGTEWLSLKQPSHTGIGDNIGYDPSAYYTTIGAPSTFSEWKHQYGFDAFIGGGRARTPQLNDHLVEAKYFNKLDLGIGRDMHCSRFGAESKGVACYVTNYGDLPLDIGVTDDLERTTLSKMHDVNNRGATVAMVYDLSIADDTKRVQFYIYNTANINSDANAELLNNIKLDSEGLKASPGLCLSCHGGSIESSSGSVFVNGGKFLPFDPNLFGFEESGDITQSAQESAFKKINSYVLDSEPTNSIKELILGLYGQGNANSIDSSSIYSGGSFETADSSFIPQGWRGHRNQYKNIAQKYCLMCHMASTSPFSNFNSMFDNTNRFQVFVKTYACESKAMPHAEVPYNSFWQRGEGYLNCQ